MEACRRKRVRGLVVVSGGFGESGPEGREAERQLVAAARASGMRVVGPNCLGIVNTDPGVRLNASLAPMVPGRGRVGFFAQSGSLGVALLERARSRNLGLSTLRVGGQPRRRQRQRPAAVLGHRPRHRGRAPAPGELRQPPQVRPPGAQRRPDQAGGGGEERPAREGHPRAGRHVGRRPRAVGGGAVRLGRRDPGRDRGADVRRRHAAGPPAAAGGEAGGDRRQFHGHRLAGRRRRPRPGAGAREARNRSTSASPARPRTSGRPSRRPWTTTAWTPSSRSSCRP